MRLGADHVVVGAGLTGATPLSTDAREAVHWHRKLVCTGPGDRFFDPCFGRLPYRARHRVAMFIPGARSVHPCGQTILPSVHERDHVRTDERRHMLAPGGGPETGALLTLEFPIDAVDWRQAEHPPPTRARARHGPHAARAAGHPAVVFCARPGEYRHLDMDQAIGHETLHADRLPAEHVA